MFPGGDDQRSASAVAGDGFVHNEGSAEVEFTVTPVNDAPVAVAPASVQIENAKAIEIVLAGTDIEGDALTYSVVKSPANGTLVGVAPNLTYIPNPEFNGVDTFTFIAEDGEVGSAEATVTIMVSEGTYTIEKGDAAAIEAAQDFALVSELESVGEPIQVASSQEAEGISMMPEGGTELTFHIGAVGIMSAGALKANAIILPALKQEESRPVLYQKVGPGDWGPVENQSYSESVITAHITHYGLYQVFVEQEESPFTFGEVYVFPNPTEKDVVSTLHIEVGIADSLKARIYDVAGDLVLTKDIQSAPIVVGDKPVYEEKLDLGRLGWGTYFGVVTAEKKGQDPLTKKFRFSVKE